MLKKLFHYKQWSDQRLMQAVVASDDIHSHSVFQFINQQFNHMVIVEELFRARISSQSDPHQDTNTTQLPTFTELFRRVELSNHWFLSYCSGLNDTELTRQINFSFVDGNPGCMSVEEILTHILHHGTYHRSAIGHAMQAAGFTRPADTFSMYLHSIGRHQATA